MQPTDPRPTRPARPAGEPGFAERSADVLHAMHEITTVSDVDFDDRARQLLKLGCRLFGVSAGAVTHVEAGRLETRYVVSPPGRMTEGTILDLHSTFCREVIESGRPFSIHDAPGTRWRDHPGHRTIGISAYLGTPIEIEDKLWGTVCFFDFEPLTEPFGDDCYALLDLFAKRIQIGLEHELVQRRFRSVLEATASKTGDGFFTSMVRLLGEVLEADMTFVAECLDPEDTRARALAVWLDGEPGENFEYATAGTPCEGLLQGGVRLYPEGVADLFPDDAELRELGLESFVAAPILGVAGKPLGHLVALRRSRMDLGEHDRWLLEIFAARAGAELERLQAEADRRELERRVVEADKLRSLGVLAGGIAHDFNNLLVGILGNADLALDEVAPGSALHGRLASIGRSARRAEALTKQMLVYAGQAPLSVEPLDLNAIVQEMPDLLGSAVSKGATIITRLEHDLAAVEADITQVRQVLMNLVINASDAIGSGRGRITITTGTHELQPSDLDGLIHAGQASPGRFAFVDVADTGSGMEEETLRKMFDPFFSTKFAGRGLGLSTVLGIVQRHAGAIHVQSRPGEGTSIRVSFPVTEVAPGTGATPAPDAAVGRLAGTVLIVDDDPEVLDVVAQTLERCGLTVHTARDGQQALTTLGVNADELGVALVDLTMPGMNGREVARRIHERAPHVGIVLMSGFNEEEAAGRDAEPGVTDFIQKPFRRQLLLETVRAALERHP